MSVENSKDWFAQGCAECRQKVLSTGLPHIAESMARHGFLMRCAACGATWEELERYSYQILESEARQAYPTAFEESP